MIGRVGVRPYGWPGSTTTTTSGLDTDVQTFITAATLTDTTQINAINDLVLDLKAAGVWTKMKAIYPMVGGTATSHKWNLKDPRDLDEAYRLVFNGGWTHDNMGALPNGINAEADTKLNLFNTMNSIDFSIGCYLNSYFVPKESVVHISSGANNTEINTGNNQTMITMSGSSKSMGLNYTSYNGLWIASRRSLNDIAVYKPNSVIVYDNGPYTTSTFTSNNVYLAHRPGFQAMYDKTRHSFDFISSGLTDNEITVLGSIIENYQIKLNRNIKLSWKYLTDYLVEGISFNIPSISLSNGAQYDSATYTYTVDGVNDYALLSYSPRPTKKITIMAWIKANQLGGLRRALVFPYGVSSWQNPYISWQIATNDNQLALSFQVNSDYDTGTLYYNGISENTWYYVVGTFNNGIIKMYLNGQLVATKDVSSSGTSIIYTNHSNMLIGLDATYMISNQWNGQLGNLEIYSEEISSSDILDRYNMTVKPTTTTTTAAPTTTTTTTVIDGYDSDAMTFINAAGLTNNTQMDAVNNLVNNLKTGGIWVKMKAIYPLVGGTAQSHKFNLKDPRDLNEAYRLTYYGSITHSSNGMLGNGTTGWADTNANVATVSPLYSEHISTNIYYGTTKVCTHIGPYQNYTGIRLSRNTSTKHAANIGGSNLSLTVLSSVGFWAASRISNLASGHTFLTNDGVFNKYTTVSNTSLYSQNYVLFYGGGGANYSNMGYSFFTIGDGLTDSELTTLKNSISTFNTALGRS